MPFRRLAAHVLSFLACALILGALLPSQARAVNVTVGGITYDLQFFAGPATFDDNALTLTNTQAAPWWGSEATATTFANEYKSVVEPDYPFDLDLDPDLLFFAYAEAGGNVDFVFLRDNGSIFSDTVTSDRSEDRFHFAYSAGIVPTPIPEIDGGALGQGAVILFAFWLMLRRRGMARAV